MSLLAMNCIDALAGRTGERYSQAGEAAHGPYQIGRGHRIEEPGSREAVQQALARWCPRYASFVPAHEKRPPPRDDGLRERSRPWRSPLASSGRPEWGANDLRWT